MVAKAPDKDIDRLARRQKCPHCDYDKTWGSAICRRCRNKLPAHMRTGLEGIGSKDPNFVMSALKAAASYFHQHFQSVRKFGGGRRKR